MNFYQRGSEQIFESVAPAPVARAPSLSQERPIERVTSNDIITTTISPDQAYEIFQGKFFGILKAKERETITTESPTEKLARIQVELQQLSVDIDKTARSKDKNKPVDGNLSATIKANADRLAEQALQLSVHPLLSDSATSSAIDARVKEIMTSINNPTKPTTATPTLREEMTVNKRLALLESVLGSASNVLDVEAVHGVTPKNKVFPLADAIIAMEQRLALLDENNLDLLKNRTKALKIELEAVSKMSQSPQALAEQKMAAESAWRKVSELHDKLKALETVVDDLPELVVRLKSLEEIHQAAGSFTQRVTEMEAAALNIDKQLASNRELLESAKKAMKDSAAAMQANVSDVEARIAALNKKR